MQEEWDNLWRNRQGKRLNKPSWSKKRMMNILDRYVSKNMTVLDAGCGSGFFSNYFISKGCKVYSLDYSEKALEITRKMTRGKSFEYLKRDLLDESLCFEFKNTFDIIFTDGLFEHFSKGGQKQIMKAFVAMKEKDGLIVTFLPNRYSFWTAVRPIFMLEIKERPFTLKELKVLVRSTDQEIIEEGGINVIPLKYSPEVFGKSLGMLLYVASKN